METLEKTMEKFETSIGIKKSDREAVTEMLSKLLADEFVLYTKTRNAHWNVEGIDFLSIHLFFEKQYQKLEKIIDNVAERIRILGFHAPGSLKNYLKMTHLHEEEPRKNNSESYMKLLLKDHETIINFIRENIKKDALTYNDDGTSDFITQLVQTHEKMAWMLRSSLNHAKY